MKRRVKKMHEPTSSYEHNKKQKKTHLDCDSITYLMEDDNDVNVIYLPDDIINVILYDYLNDTSNVNPFLISKRLYNIVCSMRQQKSSMLSEIIYNAHLGSDKLTHLKEEMCDESSIKKFIGQIVTGYDLNIQNIIDEGFPLVFKLAGFAVIYGKYKILEYIINTLSYNSISLEPFYTFWLMLSIINKNYTMFCKILKMYNEKECVIDDVKNPALIHLSIMCKEKIMSNSQFKNEIFKLKYLSQCKRNNIDTEDDVKYTIKCYQSEIISTSEALNIIEISSGWAKSWKVHMECLKMCDSDSEKKFELKHRCNQTCADINHRHFKSNVLRFKMGFELLKCSADAQNFRINEVKKDLLNTFIDYDILKNTNELMDTITSGVLYIKKYKIRRYTS